MFTPSNMLQKYLSAQPKDMFDIIGALMGYINADPTFSTNDFEKAIQYVLSNGVKREELFVPFDPDIDFEDDSSKWNEEYYSFARVYLKDNFCEKRIVHIKAVARTLYPLRNISKFETTKDITRFEDTKPFQKWKYVTGQYGGTQSVEKKTKGQQHQNHRNSITGEHPNVKIMVGIVIGVFVLLALLIVVTTQ